MRSTPCLIALALVAASTSPAFAQMRTSAPARPGAAAAAATTGGVARGDDQFRPTSILGIQRAQVLADGNAVMGLTGLNLSLGMGDTMEVGGSAGLNLNANPFVLGVPIGVYGKMLLPMLNILPNMTAAVGANANLTVGTAANSFGAGVFLPLTFWKLGPGNLHVVPGIGTTSGLGLGYEMPLMHNWSLHIGNNSTATFGATTTFSNALTVGSRVPLTPNLTADVGSISLSGTNLSVNLISINGAFGGRLGDLRKAWGH